jgi:hypothetical protein
MMRNPAAMKRYQILHRVRRWAASSPSVFGRPEAMSQTAGAASMRAAISCPKALWRFSGRGMAAPLANAATKNSTPRLLPTTMNRKSTPPKSRATRVSRLRGGLPNSDGVTGLHAKRRKLARSFGAECCHLDRRKARPLVAVAAFEASGEAIGAFPTWVSLPWHLGSSPTLSAWARVHVARECGTGSSTARPLSRRCTRRSCRVCRRAMAAAC